MVCSSIFIPEFHETNNPKGAGNDFRKRDWYMLWQGNRKGDLFSERNESIHRAQRRLVSHIYSLSNMKKLEPYVDSAILFLLKKTGFHGK